MMQDYAGARRSMIEHQVRAWDVLDPRVLEVLAAVPREHYVPERYRDVAFADTEIPLGRGQRMLAPKVEGRLLQALSPGRGDEVLEIGAGSGFLAACLGRMGTRVRSLEIFADLAAAAATALRTDGVANVTVEHADALLLDEEAAYDAIAVTASLPVYDPRFERALRPGGRLFITVGMAPAMHALRVTRTGRDQWVREPLFETVIPPLVGAPAPPRFVF
jgi:protein-L-isoaspartate(D-aspartate) O-methyltransferase